MQFTRFALAGAVGIYLLSSQPLVADTFPALSSGSSVAEFANRPQDNPPPGDRYLLWPFLLRLPGSLFLPPPARAAAAEPENEPEPADAEVADQDEPAGAVLEGTVFSEAGEPLAGVEIELVGEDGLEARLAARSAHSGADGAYRLAGLPPGRRLLRAKRGDLLPAEQAFELDDGVRQADWTLAAGLSVAGRIVDSRGRPVVGARILAFSGPAGAAGLPASSGLDGSFVLAGVEPGTVRLRGEPPQGAEAERTLTLAPGEDAAEIELVVPASAQIEGRLLGASPAALARAEVWATGPGGEHRSGYVDSGGGYSLEHLGPGEWRLAARAPGFPREAAGSALVGEGGVARLDLELDAGGYRLAGRAASGGKPLPGLRVVLSSAGVFAGGATTGAGGDFAIGSLPAGRYQLLLVGAGRAFARELELASDLEIELDPGPAAATPEVR